MTHLKSKTDNLNLSAYATKIESELKYINTSGDKMNGDIDMQSNKITNLPTPSYENEPSTKKYVDHKDRDNIKKARELIRNSRPLANHLESLS